MILYFSSLGKPFFMKKIILILLLSFLGRLSLAQNLISDFQLSSEFNKVSSFVNTYGSIDWSTAQITYYNYDTSKPWIQFEVKKNGIIQGVLRVIRVSQNKIEQVGSDYLSVFFAL